MENKKLEAIGLLGSALAALGNENRLEIVMFIKDEVKASFAEIRDKFGFNMNTVRFHLRKLMDAHLVEQTRTRGPYKLTEFGSVALELVEALRENPIFISSMEEAGGGE